MIVRAVYIISRSGLLLTQKLYGKITNPPDSHMVSSFLTALLQFSSESVAQLARAFEGSKGTAVTGYRGDVIDGFTYGSLRFIFVEKDRVFLVLVVPKSSDIDIVYNLAEKIIDEFLNEFNNKDFNHPDTSEYERFESTIDKILVSDLDLGPILEEIVYFKQLLQM